MRRIAGLVLLLTFAATAAWSQTVIDLGPGGGVRSKTWKDYERDGRTPAQQLADSLAYRDCLTRAFNALATDSLAQAETLFRRALKLMPEQPANAIVHYELGLIAGAQNRYREAADCLTQALDARPEMADARRQRAYAYLEMNQPERTLRDCNYLLDDAPADTTALFLRAAAEVKLRHYPAAQRDLTELLRLAPGHLNGRVSLAIVKQRLGRPREALEELNRLVTMARGNADCLAARADVEVELGMIEAARADLDEALRLRPNDAGLLLQRADVLTRGGHRGAARADLDRAVELGVPRASLNAQYGALNRR